MITHVLAAIGHRSESGSRTIVRSKGGGPAPLLIAVAGVLLANELAEAQMALAVHSTLVR